VIAGMRAKPTRAPPLIFLLVMHILGRRYGHSLLQAGLQKTQRVGHGDDAGGGAK
jgi:hypothetical protein